MICHFILYISNQAASTDFYRKSLAIEPTLNVPGMTEFKLGENCILGLMPSTGIKKLLGIVYRFVVQFELHLEIRTQFREGLSRAEESIAQG